VDYSLQTHAFLRLAAGSQLIDRGTDVGLPYRGGAPDLGAFESGGPPQFSTSPSDLWWADGSFHLRLNDVLIRGTVVIQAATNWPGPCGNRWSPTHPHQLAAVHGRVSTSRPGAFTALKNNESEIPVPRSGSRPRLASSGPRRSAA